jgi:hypothetical protein
MGELCAASTDDTRPGAGFAAVVRARARATSGSIPSDRAAVVRCANAAASGRAGTGATSSREGIAIAVAGSARRFWLPSGPDPDPEDARTGAEPAGSGDVERVATGTPVLVETRGSNERRMIASITTAASGEV